MPERRKSDRHFFLITLILYLAGQVFIGSYLPSDKAFHYDAPADADFLYYAGIIEQMKHAFPPQNPAFGGVALSQSFVQYYPTMAVSWLVNPYLAMRILNIVYFLIFAYLLRRYFSVGWGIGLSIITAGSGGFGLINALGIDLVARGFNHFPFFIVLTIGLFETRLKWLRYSALFLLGSLHTFLTFLTILSLGLVVLARKFRREAIYDCAIASAGLAPAILLTAGVADRPFYFPFMEWYGINLKAIWWHALPGILLVAASRHLLAGLFFGASFLFGLLFQYNPFFPVFMMNFASGLAAIEIVKRRRPRYLAEIAAGILMAGFLVAAILKYNPVAGGYYPHLDPEYGAATEWLEENTPGNAVILNLPVIDQWSCRLMEKRAVYLGLAHHVAHLGINWRARGDKVIQYYSNRPVLLDEVDYIVVGPAERKIFPEHRRGQPALYDDGRVAIYVNEDRR